MLSCCNRAGVGGASSLSPAASGRKGRCFCHAGQVPPLYWPKRLGNTSWCSVYTQRLNHPKFLALKVLKFQFFMSPEASHPDIRYCLLSNICPLPSQVRCLHPISPQGVNLSVLPKGGPARLHTKHGPRRKLTAEEHQRMWEPQVQFLPILEATQICNFDLSEEWSHPLAIDFLDRGSTDFSVVPWWRIALCINNYTLMPV